MDPFILAAGLRTGSAREEACSAGKMALNSKATGELIWQMEKADSSTPMATSTKAIGLMIKHKAKGYTSI